MWQIFFINICEPLSIKQNNWNTEQINSIGFETTISFKKIMIQAKNAVKPTEYSKTDLNCYHGFTIISIFTAKRSCYCTERGIDQSKRYSKGTKFCIQLRDHCSSFSYHAGRTLPEKLYPNKHERDVKRLERWYRNDNNNEVTHYRFRKGKYSHS